MASKLVAAALAAGALLTTTALASRADAFCRTTTISVSPDFNPSSGRCWEQGLPLWWKNSCVSYNVQKDASKQIALNDAEDALAYAFSKWTGATCPTDGTGTSRPSIDVRYLGPVNCGNVQYNSDFGNQHVIVFRDQSWPHGEDTTNTLALTTVTFNPDTGEIYDADMEVNTAQATMTLVDPVPDQGFDFKSVMTHEAGHFLGLAHSPDSRATMFAHYTPGSTVMRNITADDVAGICTVYAPNGTRAVDVSVSATGFLPGEPCDPTPRKGFSTECKTSRATKAAGCGASVAATGAPGGGIAMAAAVALTVGFGMRRRRKARRV